jgi:cytochrome c
MPNGTLRGRHWLGWAGSLLALVWCASTATFAQVAEPSADKGKELAVRLCSGCHLVDNAAGQAIPVGTPTFRSMATKPGQTGEGVAAVLIQPHPPMPDIHLSRMEIEDIIAYLDALRSDEALPPLRPPTGGAKPTLPSKS